MIYLITGGQRSGKSSYAQKLASGLSESPIYVATARRWDPEFELRIERHIEDRDESWTTIEVEKELGSVPAARGEVMVIDCITLWLTNFFTDLESDVDRCLEEGRKEIEKLITRGGTFIFVTNEIGMGIHPSTSVGRKFVDLLGKVNQYIAGKADKVTLMVSGIPVEIKK